MRTFEGIWPALVTPFTEDRQVNGPVLRALVDYLIQKRVDGFFVGGTTGEGIFSPVPVRKQMVETVIQQVAGRVPVIAHVGAVALGDAVDLARHARDAGAAGVSSILPPLYLTQTAIHAYFKAIADSVPDLPTMFYLLNPNYDAVAVVRDLLDIPTLAGGKYTGPNMYEMRHVIDIGKATWSIWSGMDEECVYAAMMGATGAIGSTINFMPGVYRTIRDCVRQGEYAAAQDLQVRANRVTAMLVANNFQPSLKAVMTKLVGQDMGQPLLPYLPLSEDGRAQLWRDLAQTDFEELTRL